jgi:hypothetical protein
MADGLTIQSYLQAVAATGGQACEIYSLVPSSGVTLKNSLSSGVTWTSISSISASSTIRTALITAIRTAGDYVIFPCITTLPTATISYGVGVSGNLSICGIYSGTQITLYGLYYNSQGSSGSTVYELSTSGYPIAIAFLK